MLIKSYLICIWFCFDYHVKSNINQTKFDLVLIGICNQMHIKTLLIWVWLWVDLNVVLNAHQVIFDFHLIGFWLACEIKWKSNWIWFVFDWVVKINIHNDHIWFDFDYKIVSLSRIRAHSSRLNAQVNSAVCVHN